VACVVSDAFVGLTETACAAVGASAALEVNAPPLASMSAVPNRTTVERVFLQSNSDSESPGHCSHVSANGKLRSRAGSADFASRLRESGRVVRRATDSGEGGDQVFRCVVVDVFAPVRCVVWGAGVVDDGVGGTVPTSTVFGSIG